MDKKIKTSQFETHFGRNVNTTLSNISTTMDSQILLQTLILVN